MGRLRDRYGRFMARTSAARERVKRNAWPWFLWAAMAALVIGWIAPHQIGVLIWNVCKLSLAAFAGFWIDHNLFYDARPDDPRMNSWEAQHARYRRAALVIGAMLAMGASV